MEGQNQNVSVFQANNDNCAIFKGSKSPEIKEPHIKNSMKNKIKGMATKVLYKIISQREWR